MLPEGSVCLPVPFNASFQIIVMNSAFYKGRELAQLGTSHSRLHIRCFSGYIQNANIHIYDHIPTAVPVLAVKTIVHRLSCPGAHTQSLPQSRKERTIL